MEYVHLPSGSTLPTISSEPRRIIVLIAQEVEARWQDKVSDWIVDSGCLYMMAWGEKCVTWDDSVDHAKLRRFEYGEVPDERFVMTTWHENEPLCEVFFHARLCAFHPTVPLPVLTIVDITSEPREEAIRALHLAEKSELLEDVPEDPRQLPFRERLRNLLGRK
ncbi:DUF7684 family protein [Qipengyuania marisflavi]|uniref:DUF7684 domain-containing protein n=1 Tax=Qipengyuania marisflavi TaxID=2486356 RepID=A0A5S3PC58_9SPHN|nr:hypothetical protein [Qipengyuania marisflavi]TMM50345.1 hypothetical protein FEV51_04000 [Qipengyuania marisflavi]